jgi:TetR/AcrR family transcriptional regulator, transcriptional repressor of aconitase
VKAIADEVGITSGAVYHYFPSKQQLLEVLSVALIDMAVGRLRQAAEARDDFVGRVIAIIDELDSIHREQPSLAEFTLVLTSDVARYPELQVAYESCLAMYADLCRWLVDDAVAAGELPAGVDRRSVIDMLHATISGITSMFSLVPPSHHEGMVRCAKRLFTGTLFVRP